MKYKVIKTFQGSPDGYTVNAYCAGETVDLPEDLAKVALAEKWVEKPKGKKSDAVEHKAAIDTLQGEIAALEKSLGNSAEADKPTIDAQISVKRAELEDLEAE